MGLELRPREDGSFDELVGDNCSVHFEMMDDKRLWVSVRSGKKEYHVWITSRGKLTVNSYDESEV
jgi:hypothetical protein